MIRLVYSCCVSYDYGSGVMIPRQELQGLEEFGIRIRGGQLPIRRVITQTMKFHVLCSRILLANYECRSQCDFICGFS